MNKISILFVLFFSLLSCYGQSKYYLLPNDTLYNENGFNLKFKSLVRALPKDYSLTPIIYHKYEINDSFINFITFKKIWWGDLKIDPGNFELTYQQDPLYLHLHKKLPEFNLQDLKGNTFNSNRLLGKPTLITFWSIGCTGCIAEMPALDKLKEKYGNSVNFIAIGFNSSEIISKFLERKPFSFFHLVDGLRYSEKALNISAIPRNIFLDRNNVIQEIKVGLPGNIENNTVKVKNAVPFDIILRRLTKQ